VHHTTSRSLAGIICSIVTPQESCLSDDLDDGERAQLVSLFQLTFRDPADVIENVRGEPLCLLMAMNMDGRLWLKPKNLITGLPIRQVEAVN
jgi:hypothetical protein